MAYSEKQWLDAKGYYEAGLSLSKIKDKTGIARNTVSQRAKRELWEQGANTDYIEAKELIATKKGTISEQSLVIADEIADDNIRRKKLVYGITEKALSKIDKALSRTVIVKDEDGKETEEEVEHSSKDIRDYVEAIDKASITLGVNHRHAQPTKIENTNAQQTNNNLEITFK